MNSETEKIAAGREVIDREIDPLIFASMHRDFVRRYNLERNDNEQ